MKKATEAVEEALNRLQESRVSAAQAIGLMLLEEIQPANLPTIMFELNEAANSLIRSYTSLA